MIETYDIIVIGAGHAGCEAAAAAAKMGSKTLLITMDMTKFAQMSCNPAIGGIAKGQIVREIDALGGLTGIVTDKTLIQFRMLNKSKGPAMWSPRAQSDKTQFSLVWRNLLENTTNLDIWQDVVFSLLIENNICVGVKTIIGAEFKSKSVVLTNGTFLNGKIHVGTNNYLGGRTGELSSLNITEQLKSLGISSGRMKTGTPARLDGRSINFEKLIEQKGDDIVTGFSFLENTLGIKPEEQKSCFIAHTNLDVHGTLQKGFKESPLFSGTIKGVGPRYCPSIEDKIVTFNDKDSHLLFLEPEGFNTNEFYLNGFSSSLPLDVQYNALRQIEGFENLKIYRPGYAIEYDYFDPTQLKPTLESKIVKSLFFAGQINGTTGYEEAAAQGLMAGINAHLSVHTNSEFILNRDEAYIGVLIDDLVTKGVTEPYRMFTSRAEYRILLRQDNADLRLTEKSFNIGLADSKRFLLTKNKYETIDKIIESFNSTNITPEEINPLLEKTVSNILTQKTKASNLLLRPQLNIFEILSIKPELIENIEILGSIKNEIFESAELEVKYAGYIEREKIIAEKIKRLEYIKLNDDIDYSQFKSLSTEARQKLNKIKPKTIGQASRISGVSPSDINVLLLFLGR